MSYQYLLCPDTWYGHLAIFGKTFAVFHPWCKFHSLINFIIDRIPYSNIEYTIYDFIIRIAFLMNIATMEI